MIHAAQIKNQNSTYTKTAMVCKLTQIHRGIWLTVPLEGKKWLLNERKRQQQEDDKMKK
jgi:hypothetical protein